MLTQPKKAKTYPGFQRMVANLRQEKVNLETDLAAALGSSNKKKIDKEVEDVVSVVTEYKGWKVGIRSKEDELKEVDKELKRQEERVRKLRAAIGTEQQYVLRVLEGKKTVEKLENKLCTINRSFGMIQAENAKLKTEIDYHLKQRFWKNVHD